MASLTVPAMHQEPAPPGASTSKPNKMYPQSLVFSSEGLGLEELMSIKAVIDSDDDDDDSNPPVMTQAMRCQKSLQFAALCMAVCLAGLNDTLIGPLIPWLQEVYRVGYTTVSLIFIASSTVRLLFMPHLGRERPDTSIQAFAPPFLVFITTSFSIGFACMFLISTALTSLPSFAQCLTAYYPLLQNGGSTVFVTSLAEDTTVRLSVMYTAYGVAATCAPLLSARFARLSNWSSVFLVTVGCAVSTMTLQVLAFKFKSQADCLKEIGQPRVDNAEDSPNAISKYKRIFRLPTRPDVHLLALFLFMHVGIEVTISGWIVTFMTERHGGPYSGYILSGFWGGSTVGRLMLIPLTKKLGEWRALRLYIFIAIGLELTVWLISSFTVNAVAVICIGFVFGPIYATVMTHTGQILPPELMGGAISWITIFTSTGSVVFPFIAGAIASSGGMDSLPPLLMAMEGLMLGIWAFVLEHGLKLTLT
ncbi:hypothetical protein V8D89_008724 [Ganoderma adspersum]